MTYIFDEIKLEQNDVDSLNDTRWSNLRLFLCHILFNQLYLVER